jgi:Cytochrome oxidase complex assembly protein 1
MMTEAAKPGWWDRNWGWVVGGGAVTTLAVVGIGGYYAFFGFVGMLTSTDAYKTALAKARANPAVIATTGVPITEGVFPAAQVKLSNSDGTANYLVALSGPRGGGDLEIVGVKTNGVWTLTKLEFRPNVPGPKIDLLKAAP